MLQISTLTSNIIIVYDNYSITLPPKIMNTVHQRSWFAVDGKIFGTAVKS